jgi:hypothetical protein
MSGAIMVWALNDDYDDDEWYDGYEWGEDESVGCMAKSQGVLKGSDHLVGKYVWSYIVTFDIFLFSVYVI